MDSGKIYFLPGATAGTSGGRSLKLLRILKRMERLPINLYSLIGIQSRENIQRKRSIDFHLKSYWREWDLRLFLFPIFTLNLLEI